MLRSPRITLSLVAGFLIALLLAWCAAAWSPLEYDAKWITSRYPPRQLPVEVPAALLERSNANDNIPLYFEYVKASGPAVQFDQCSITDYYDRNATRFSYTLYNAIADRRLFYSWRAGWPMACLGGYVTGDEGLSSEDRGPWTIRISSKLNPPWRTGQWWYRPQGAYLPCRPLPLGLAVDALIYATAAFVSVRVALVLRAARRVRRGLCPRCAYDRRDLATGSPCPECGDPAPRALTASPAPTPAPPPPAEAVAAPQTTSP